MQANRNTNKAGRLYVFEGPDGVGKSTLIQHAVKYLHNTNGRDAVVRSFPGREEGTLGRHVYELHHNPENYNVNSIDNISLQTLHIAAHIDCIQKDILPALASGKTVILDRYWWSTVAYGLANGIPAHLLDTLVELEKQVWAGVYPDCVFLITCNKSFRPELSDDKWLKVVDAYSKLAEKEQIKYSVKIINNSGDILNSIADISKFIGRKTHKRSSFNHHHNIDYWLPTKTSVVFDTFWRFAAERQSIFFNKIYGNTEPLTKDPIFGEYKFTNAYRASDRVSQYLIRNIIYKGSQKHDDLFFRIILFKLFNKIETWELLVHKFGEISYADYDYKEYDRVLWQALEKGRSIYSAAYIMPSGSRSFRHKYKHRNNLKLLEMMMSDCLYNRIGEASSMQNVFELLRQYPMIGDFLAYQYTIDINYSILTDFDEMSFVVPGPGAKDGIRKCFPDTGGLSDIDLIKKTADHQQDEFARLDIEFRSLWGRNLQLIDIQNLFCEVDKYSRIAHPKIDGVSGRKRIKQRYQPKADPIEYFYPPKWGINEAVNVTLRNANISGRCVGRLL